jgi:hypothetical protein
MKLGIERVRPLEDGFEGWRGRGYPVDDLAGLTRA